MDVSISHTSNYSSATLKFIVDSYDDDRWAAVINHYDSNNNYFLPRSTPGDWSYARLYFNAYDTNQSTYTSSELKAIAGHEIGHAFGLEDLTLTSDRYKLMWWQVGPYLASGITTDEINWIRTIYSN